jgi:hypothetical protein
MPRGMGYGSSRGSMKSKPMKSKKAKKKKKKKK